MMNLEIEVGDKVVACFGEVEDFHVLKDLHKYKTQIGEVVTVGKAYIYVKYDDGTTITSLRNLFSPVKILLDGAGNEVYRIYNVAGGFSYLSDIGYGNIILYDTCINDSTTMLLILNDVMQERRKEDYDKLRFERQVQHGSNKFPTGGGILSKSGSSTAEGEDFHLFDN